MNDDEAWAKVRSARVGRLATITPSPPRILFLRLRDARTRPDHVVYWAVDHKPKRSSELQRINNMKMNPFVEFVVDDYDDREPVVVGPVFGNRRDWSMTPSNGGRRSTRWPSKYRRYVVEPPDGPVVAIDIDRISGWQATPDPAS